MDGRGLLAAHLPSALTWPSHLFSPDPTPPPTSSTFFCLCGAQRDTLVLASGFPHPPKAPSSEVWSGWTEGGCFRTRDAASVGHGCPAAALLAPLIISP